MTTKTRRAFTDEFKAETVTLLESSGRTGSVLRDRISHVFVDASGCRAIAGPASERQRNGRGGDPPLALFPHRAESGASLLDSISIAPPPSQRLRAPRADLIGVALVGWQREAARPIRRARQEPGQL